MSSSTSRWIEQATQSDDIKAFSVYLKGASRIISEILNKVVWDKTSNQLVSCPENCKELLNDAALAIHRTSLLISKHVDSSSSMSAAENKTKLLNQEPSVLQNNSLNVNDKNQQQQVLQEEQLCYHPETNASVTRILIAELTIKLQFNRAQLQKFIQEYQTTQKNLSDNLHDLSIMRKRIENIEIAKSKIEELESLEAKMIPMSLSSMDREELALQLTLLSLELFRELKPDTHIFTYLNDGSCSSIQKIIDFEKFIERSFVGAILLPGTTQGVNVDEITIGIMTTISIALQCFHHYKNISVSMALLRALKSPEIQRLKNVWSLIPQKLKSNFKLLLEQIGASDDDYDHQEPLILDLICQQSGMNSYQQQQQQIVKSAQKKNNMKMPTSENSSATINIVIPRINCIIRKLNMIRHDFTMVDKSENNPFITLTGTGNAQKDRIIFLLRKCQSLSPKSNINSLNGVSGLQHDDMNYPPTVNELGNTDLLNLGFSKDLGIEYWILNRVYLSKFDLWNLSSFVSFNKKELNPYEPPVYNVMVEQHSKTNSNKQIPLDKLNDQQLHDKAIEKLDEELQKGNETNKQEIVVEKGDGHNLKKKEEELILSHETEVESNNNNNGSCTRHNDYYHETNKFPIDELLSSKEKEIDELILEKFKSLRK